MVEERLSAEWLRKNQHTESYRLHKDRYHAAVKHIAGGRTLDIACGVGYGSAILTSVTEVVGVDLEEAAVAQARENYPEITFIASRYQDYTTDIPFDNIVSLETLEHLENPESFVAFCHASLKKGGKLIISAPVSYTTDLNSFHLQDFTEKSFNELITKVGFTQEKVLLKQDQKMLSAENTQKLSTEEWCKLVLSYLLKPRRIFLRMHDLWKNGLTIKYAIIAYEK